MLTAGWQIDDGIYQSAAVVAQRGVSGREQEGIFANEALRGRKRLSHKWQMAKMKPAHDALDGLVPGALRRLATLTSSSGMRVLLTSSRRQLHYGFQQRHGFRGPRPEKTFFVIGKAVIMLCSGML